MNKLTKIQRFRLDDQTVYELDKLKSFGLNKSKFVRQAITEKIQRDMPKIISDRKRKEGLIKLPF